MLGKIPAAWQVFLVMLALLGLGAKLSGYTGLPEKVEANTQAIHDIVEDHTIERNLMLRMLCNQDPAETFQSCERKYSGVNSN